MSQLKKKASSRSPERDILNAWIPAELTRPYYMSVRSAFIRKFTAWYVCATDTTRLDERKRLERQWKVLASLLSGGPPTIRNHDWRNLRTQPQIVRVLRHAWRVAADHADKGRPRSNLRRLALHALDLRHRDLGLWTWHKLGMHFGIHKCSEAGHDRDCQKKWQGYRECQKRRDDDLRREAQLVKKSLRELGVTLPTQRNNH